MRFPFQLLLFSGCVVDEAVGHDAVEHEPLSAAIEENPAPRVSAGRPERATSSSRPAPPPPPERPCPPEMALVGAVCVDRYEAHLRVGDRIHPPYERPQSDARYVATSAPDVLPQAYISRVEAADACAAAGKRLCTRTEWTAACRGTPLDACNRGKRHLLPILFPEAGWRFSYEEHFNNPAVNRQPGYLALTAEHDGCVSDAGAHDMVGNVHEWISDPVTRGFIDAFEREMPRQWQPITVGNGIFMGGFYSTANEHGAGCAFTTVAHDPGYHDYSTGFRCCRDRGEGPGQGAATVVNP